MIIDINWERESYNYYVNMNKNELVKKIWPSLNFPTYN